MRIGQKISLGFAVILILAGLLGGLALLAMRDASLKATDLAEAKVPAVTVANEVERDSLETMYNIRGYTMSDNDDMLKLGEASLAQAKMDIAAAQKLASDKGLPKLREHSEAAAKAATTYGELLESTKKAVLESRKAIAERARAGEEFTALIEGIIDDQQGKLAKELEAGADGAKLAERCLKLQLANEIIDTGSSIRIAAFKSQAMRDPKIFESKLALFAEIGQRTKRLIDMAKDPKNLDQLRQLEKATASYKAAAEDYLAQVAALADLSTKRMAAAEAVVSAARESAQANILKTKEAADASSKELGSASNALMVGLVVVVLLGITFAVLITRGIVLALARVSDELGACSEQTASASEQVASGAQSLANGTSENAAALEETSASLEEMNSLVRQSAQSSESANGVASQARAAGERGAEAMAELGKAIAEIKANADQTAKIVKTIDEIAFQTNLLALNAAVEAARAGDAGKGFAVVAEEVRNLAQRAGEAARNTSQLIEQSVKSAEQGVNLSKNVTAVVSEMTGASKKVNDLVGEVAASAKEIATGIDQVSKAVRQMDQVTQGNAASAEENSAVGEEMSAQAQSLAQLVTQLVAMIRTTEGGGSGAGLHQTQTRITTTSAPKRTTVVQTPTRHPTATQPPVKRTTQHLTATAGSPDAKAAIPFDDDQANHQTLNKF